MSSVLPASIHSRAWTYPGVFLTGRPQLGDILDLILASKTNYRKLVYEGNVTPEGVQSRYDVCGF